MSLHGDAAVLIWNDVLEDAQADFREWHNREHAIERSGIPGFQRSRRYRAVDHAARYFMLYELDSANALTSPGYLDRLSNPTAWTRRMGPVFSNSSRSLCHVRFSRGVGQGGLIYTLAYDVAPGREDEHYRHLAHKVLPALADEPGVVGAHLCSADMSKSGVKTEEKKGRVIAVRSWAVLVESAASLPATRAVCNGLTDAVLAANAIATPDANIYQLEYSRGKSHWG